MWSRCLIPCAVIVGAGLLPATPTTSYGNGAIRPFHEAKPAQPSGPRVDVVSAFAVRREIEIRRDPSAATVRLIIPKAWLDEQGVKKVSEVKRRTPTIVAGLAISLAVSLGGLTLLRGRIGQKSLRVGIYVFSLAAACGGGYAYANLSPSSWIGGATTPVGFDGRPLVVNVDGQANESRMIRVPLPESVANPPKLTLPDFIPVIHPTVGPTYRAEVVVDFVDVATTAVLVLNNDVTLVTLNGRNYPDPASPGNWKMDHEPLMPPGLPKPLDQFRSP